MAKRPSFQFYPADWRGNTKLRRCSPAARGAWMDVMCLLHDSDEYGVLRWKMSEISQAAGVSRALLKELSDKDVMKGSDAGFGGFEFAPTHAGKLGATVVLVEATIGPCWFSSRLVRDEWIRQRRGASTRFDANNQPPKPGPNGAPKPRIGERRGDGPSSASASASASSLSSISPIPGVNTLEGELSVGELREGYFEGHSQEQQESASAAAVHLVAVSTALRAAGCPDVSATNAYLVAAITDGFTLEQLKDAATVYAGKPIAYLVKALRNQREEANSGKPTPRGPTRPFNPDGPSPARETETPQEREENWARQCHTFGQLSASELASELADIRGRHSGTSVAAAEN